jgi:hypothetical protein
MFEPLLMILVRNDSKQNSSAYAKIASASDLEESMSFQRFLLSEQTASLPVGPLLEQATSGRGVEVHDTKGNVVAYVLPANDADVWLYAEARVYFAQHREEIEAAGRRKGGVTTAELLAKAAALAEQSKDQ